MIDAPVNLARVYAVLGYGCHLTPALRCYLDGAAQQIGAEIEAHPERSALLFCSGGFTMHGSAPGVSEARLMADYLRERGLTLPQVLDEEARTTLENLRHLSRLCAARAISAREVVICCDEARQGKIAHVARHLLGAAPTLWSYPLERTTMQAVVQRTLGLGYDALALRVPAIERIGLRLIDARNARA